MTEALDRLVVWARFVSRLGFPAVVAAFLLYFVTQTVAGDIRMLKGQHDALVCYLTQICWNTAKDTAERIACDSIRP